MMRIIRRHAGIRPTRRTGLCLVPLSLLAACAHPPGWSPPPGGNPNGAGGGPAGSGYGPGAGPGASTTPSHQQEPGATSP